MCNNVAEFQKPDAERRKPDTQENLMGELHSYNFRTITTNPLVVMEWELGILNPKEREKMLCGDGNVLGCEGGYMDVWVSQDSSNCTLKRGYVRRERRAQRLGVLRAGAGEGVNQPEEDGKILGDMVPPGG